MELVSIGTPALWMGFTALVLGLLALDLGVFHRDAHEVRFREALAWSVVWVTLALAFNAWVAWQHGAERGLEFLTGYLIEKALAVDNIFVILLVFATFAVPRAFQHRVLFWGILGAFVMRASFIFAGAALLERFDWLMYVFGGFLVVTGVKLLVQSEAELHPERNPLFRLFTRLVPSVRQYHGARFTVRRRGRLYATPLLLVLVCIEATDLVFAVDSIPAIFAVTKDPFIVFTSNVFAILGLRSMFFLLAGVMDRFHYLKVGLAFVLVFVEDGAPRRLPRADRPLAGRDRAHPRDRHRRVVAPASVAGASSGGGRCARLRDAAGARRVARRERHARAPRRPAPSTCRSAAGP